MAQHRQLTQPNDPNQDIWSYHELLQINPIVFGDHLVVILQVPLVHISLRMNVYEVYNVLILHPVYRKLFIILEKAHIWHPHLIVIMPIFCQNVTC